jgi:hypothetical protein
VIVEAKHKTTVVLELGKGSGSSLGGVKAVVSGGVDGIRDGMEKFHRVRIHGPPNGNPSECVGLKLGARAGGIEAMSEETNRKQSE